MANKRSEYRFCIQFSDTDPRQQKVVEILNAKGRRKAQFIAAAVLHYLDSASDVHAPENTQSLRSMIEAVVREVLQTSRPIAEPSMTEINTVREVNSPMQTSTDPTNEVLEGSVLRALQNSIQLFRTQK